MHIIKTFAQGVMIFLTVAGINSMISDVSNTKKYTPEELNEMKAYIKEESPNTYINLVEKRGNKCISNKALVDAYKTVQDSVKKQEHFMDSLKIEQRCAEAYAKGAQMVRDSLKQAENL